MNLLCAPSTFAFPKDDEGTVQVLLYDRTHDEDRGSVGAALKDQILRGAKLAAAPRAWDFLSIALSVLAADVAGHRGRSPDGWTREFSLEVSVGEPTFWNAQHELLEAALAFLTTDRWQFTFLEGGFQPATPKNPAQPTEDSVALLSGGLDSLVGTIDLAADGRRPYAVSQVVKGDAAKQDEFARRIGGGLSHLSLNHNVDIPDPEAPPSQRGRSIVFLAYGVIVATSLRQYQEGAPTELFISENCFISANPPLTSARVGSLSTRTTHPVFLKHIQQLLRNAELRVELRNPYQAKTKGEMLLECDDQALLRELASTTTSCGRFGHFGYRHCGRCVPCQIRRAAFLRWGTPDKTEYIYENLGIDDEEHARFDDVRAAAMAIAEVATEGFDEWLGPTLSTANLGDVTDLKAAVQRGLIELDALHRRYGVK